MLILPYWQERKAVEYIRLDWYHSQFMFGDHVQVKDHSNMFHLIWTYTIKELDNARKLEVPVTNPQEVEK